MSEPMMLRAWRKFGPEIVAPTAVSEGRTERMIPCP